MKKIKNLPKQIPPISNTYTFLSRIAVNTDTECWDWCGGIYKETGYGYFSQNGVNLRAHRVSFSIFKGDLDLSKVIDHICRNKKCVNPDHLREVDSATNTLENSISPSAINKVKLFCKYGHKLIGENLMIGKKTGKRNCRICKRARDHAVDRGLDVSHIPLFFNYKKAKTHCKNGHEINAENTYTRSSGVGYTCRKCSNLYKQVRVK